MIIDLITKRILSHILTIILALEDYPQERIDAFCQAFIDAAKHNGTVDYIALAETTEEVLAPFHNARTTTNIDKKAKTTDIKVIKANEDFVKNGLKDLETKINVISNNNQILIEEFNLNKKSIFYSGAEADRVLHFEELYKGIKSKPSLTTLVAQALDFTNQCVKLYNDKTAVNTSIISDVSDKKILIDPLKDVMFQNYLSVCGYNISNLSKVGDYFRTNLMEADTNLSGFLFKDEYMVLVGAGMTINDPRIDFEFDSYLRAESLGLGDCMVFLSDVANPTTIPGRAILVKAGETIEFPFRNIGSATELYLIFAAVTTGEAVKLKVTIKPKK